MVISKQDVSCIFPVQLIARVSPVFNVLKHLQCYACLNFLRRNKVRASLNYEGVPLSRFGILDQSAEGVGVGPCRNPDIMHEDIVGRLLHPIHSENKEDAAEGREPDWGIARRSLSPCTDSVES